MNAMMLSDYDVFLFHEGNLQQAYQFMGAHVRRNPRGTYTEFCVWAPNARSVSLVGSFNEWKSSGFELERWNQEGLWVIQVNRDLTGETYKYEITSLSGERKLKADPYGFATEKRPQTASIVYDLGGFRWSDEEWLQKRSESTVYDQPLSIYEVHLGTWKKKKGKFLSYTELAEEMIPYVKEHGFTHIELLPITEHPFDRSWGYQSTGYYAPTSRYGEPHDLMAFINECHRHDIGVILDWVPGHFCKDAHGLYEFDGSFAYEYGEERDRENYTWGTANFDLGKGEVRSFLISNARFWMEVYHIDGFRIDAVANIIYWANQGEQSPNEGAIEFLKKLNQAVFEYDSSILMIAEDSTDWPQVTSPVHYGGLGFNYKWNMGWMNDVLDYMETPHHERKDVHSLMTFSLLYAFSENYVLPFSHDEVVHGKKSLLNKMPGDYWQKFAQYRLLLSYMMAHPGKKLLFMGSELAPFSEWKDLEELDWHLTGYEFHHKFNSYFKDLLHLYKGAEALYELDHRSDGFEWIDVNNANQQIFSFIRKGKNDESLVVICNFSPQVYHEYKIGVPRASFYEEIWNSDDEKYGGSHQVNPLPLSVHAEAYHGKDGYIKMTIPPYAAVYLKPGNERGV
ncbi:1,4-alpha-glucan branching enzyme [Rossellomorea aquimaris]|uniref:1,4-alpha-glucan branching enzyme n=1 Tax=Rossellomorea aquimaris TaxID=189382 RepID=UPI001CD69C3F|nr:1,4-alpha-glucan branching enzyme [Rossellomorea aquimaris]MCA1056782.1 1,4-alpha-glucan branching enzyme [Rossellomorea aquimaris]